MIGWTNGDGGKGLRVLVLRRQTFGQQVVERFVERNRNEIRRLHVPLRINDRVTDTELNIFDRHEREHVRRHELIGRAVLALGPRCCLLLGVPIGRVDHVRRQPCVEIVELEPLTGRDLNGKHRYGGVVSRQNVRAMLRVTPSDPFALDTDGSPPSIERYTATRVGEITAVTRLFVLHAGKIVKVSGFRDTRTVDALSRPRVIAYRAPDRDVMCDVHLDLGAIDTMHQQALLVVTDIHAENRANTHLEDFVLRQDMQTRVCQVEVRHVGLPLCYMTMSVRVIRRERVALKGIVLQIELQVFLLAFVEQRIPTLRLHQPCGYIVAGIGLDGGVRIDNAIGRQLLQKIVNLRVLDHLRNPLRPKGTRNKEQGAQRKEYYFTSYSVH